jgi:type IV secretory pathway VirJ component
MAAAGLLLCSAAASATAAAAATPSASLAAISDLPVTIVPAAAGSSSPWFAILLSGDGGWVALDRGVSKELAKHGMPIVGWDSLKYFWVARTPDGIAHDLDRVMRHFAAKWHKTHVLLIGYSQGADTMPFMENRLPAQTREMVGLTALLGLSDNALFQIHLANLLGNARGVPTAPELKEWSGPPYLCIYGEEDRDAACDQLTGPGGVVIKMSGGHHFGGKYAQVAQEILSRLPQL